jgi:hypothetical protein
MTACSLAHRTGATGTDAGLPETYCLRASDVLVLGAHTHGRKSGGAAFPFTAAIANTAPGFRHQLADTDTAMAQNQNTKSQKATGQKQAPKRPPHQQDFSVPEAFADNFETMIASDGCVYLSFSARRTEPPQKEGTVELKSVTSARLTLTIPAAIKMVNQLQRLFLELEEAGVIKGRDVAAPQRQK